MLKQFFGKPFYVTLGVLGAAHLVGFFTLHTWMEPVCLVVIGLITLVAAVRNIHVGILIAFAELFATSHGHLFSAEIFGFSFSVRMAIFAAVMLAWLVGVARKKYPLPLRDPKLYAFWIVFAAMAIGTVVGVFGNDLGNVFTDAKSYVFLALVFPMASVPWPSAEKRRLLQVACGAAAWVVFVSLASLYIFTHFGPEVIRPTYVFLRDARIAEITMLEGGLYRIFLQSQFSVVIMFFFLISSFLFADERPKDRWKTAGLLAYFSSAVLLSLSRSYWLGMCVGLLLLLGLAFSRLRRPLKPVAKTVGYGLAACLGSLAILYFAAFFPLPKAVGPSGFADMFADRAETQDVASTSRWKLLPVMQEAIASSPILGLGLGKELAYETDDPRIRALIPDGMLRTIRFEWGWHDLWLKLGLLGPIGFTVVFIWLMLGLWNGVVPERKWLSYALMASLLTMYVTQTFSPYLNHPLGLGFLAFLLPFIESRRLAFQPAELLKTRPMAQAAPGTPALTSKT